MMSEPTVQDLIMESMATIAQLNERHAILEAAYLKARAVLNMVILDGTIAAVSRELDPATNLRAFIDRYIEQGEELRSAKAMLTRVTTADAVDDLFSAKTECLLWLDANPERSV